MRGKDSGFFWPSFADLMTSLFFIMLVLYVLTYIQLNEEIKVREEKLAIITAVEENLKPLKEDTSLFVYETDYKRFKLSFDVNFEIGQHELAKGKLKNYDYTMVKVKRAGLRLKKLIDALYSAKVNNPELKNVSYILVIAGYASYLNPDNQWNDYELSYKRAYNLWSYWKDTVHVDFEEKQYHDLIDLQLTGNGYGGVGRVISNGNKALEQENQRFIIQIFPKIGDLEGH